MVSFRNYWRILNSQSSGSSFVWSSYYVLYCLDLLGVNCVDVLSWEFLVGRTEGDYRVGGEVVIIRTNPNLIKEIQLTVWEAREYLTAVTTAQITGPDWEPSHNILLLLPTSDYHHITQLLYSETFTTCIVLVRIFWDVLFTCEGQGTITNQQSRNSHSC